MLFLTYQINRTVTNESVWYWRLSAVTKTQSAQLEGITERLEPSGEERGECAAAAATAAKSLQSCPTLRDPRDGSPPGSTVPGILQARTLEWVAISFSNA